MCLARYATPEKQWHLPALDWRTPDAPIVLFAVQVNTCTRPAPSLQTQTARCAACAMMDTMRPGLAALCTTRNVCRARAARQENICLVDAALERILSARSVLAVPRGIM